MAKRFQNEYTPEVVSLPGETLAEALEHRAMSQADLAERMGRPKKTINEIVNGKAEITPETALQLERVLGVPASFWTNLERHYRESLARLAERERLASEVAWPKEFPLREMARLGWLPRMTDKVEQVKALLSFFGVSSVEQWRAKYQHPVAAFRLAKAFEPNVYALSAWLRQGERLAQNIECAPFEASAFRRMLLEAKRLTLEEDPDVFVERLRDLGATCGVAIVFVPELRGSRTCGATRWLNAQKALLQLSLRYKTNDHLWFTFFHEAGHIILHGKRDVFVEGKTGSGTKAQEDEANQFASDRLIPPAALATFLGTGTFSHERVEAFAERIGIAPGIVVGRLQHDKHIPYSHLNGLKVSYRWSCGGD